MITLTTQEIQTLRTALEVCKLLEIDGVVIDEGKIRGAKPSLDAAIISEIDLDLPAELRLGIGRTKELEKRLALFQGTQVTCEIKANDSNDATLLALAAGKVKVQFRCTSPKLMRYPKSNDDPAHAVIKLTRDEAQQVSRAAKTLGAEHLIVHVTGNGVTRLECADSSNDRFEMELATPAAFMSEEAGFVQTYLASLLLSVIDQIAKDSEEVDLVIGEGGSATALVKGHTVAVFPQISGGEE